MGLKSLEDVTYFRLNNEINRPVNGQIMLHKDKEALDAFFKENVVPNTKTFDSITDKIQYLLEHNYIERAFIEKYRPEFLEELAQFIKDQTSNSSPFMAAYKFYNQYALKTNDGEYYLESMEDRVFSMLSILLMEMKLSRETSQTKLSTNATNQLLLLS